MFFAQEHGSSAACCSGEMSMRPERMWLRGCGGGDCMQNAQLGADCGRSLVADSRRGTAIPSVSVRTSKMVPTKAAEPFLADADCCWQ
jgi:hypothetical protein